MKAEITQNKKAFEPIEVKITIESMEELQELCMRLYLGVAPLNNATTRYGAIETDRFNELWDELDSLHNSLK